MDALPGRRLRATLDLMTKPNRPANRVQLSAVADFCVIMSEAHALRLYGPARSGPGPSMRPGIRPQRTVAKYVFGKATTERRYTG